MDNRRKTVAVFEKYAKQYEQKFMAYEPYLHTYKQFSNLIQSQHQRVLDVACGPGNISKYLLQTHPQLNITGTDLSDAMLELARLNCPSAIFRKQDGLDFDATDETFDIIIAGFYLPYLSSDEVLSFFQKAHNKINNSGLLYISFMEGSLTGPAIAVEKGDDGIETYYHSIEFIEKALKDNNFEVLENIRKPIETFESKTSETKKGKTKPHELREYETGYEVFIFSKAQHR